MTAPVYALNLFNVTNKDEYLTYARRSASEVAAHGGRVVALGKFREAAMKVLYERCAAPLQYCVRSWLPDVHEARMSCTRPCWPCVRTPPSFRSQLPYADIIGERICSPRTPYRCG